MGAAFMPSSSYVTARAVVAVIVIVGFVSWGTAAAAHTEQDGSTPNPPADASDPQAPPPERSALEGIVFGVGFDGYYAWNSNQPVGRINLLRAYDVSSDSFSLNQANVIVERPPDVEKGRRAGLRLDLMFGQATETLQGSAANEPRPQVYRNVFQAYGSYVFPVGSGLQVDFGKFASALGFENNYTKDQINYSRSYFFDYLPFYHFGFRSTYAPTQRLSLTYWLVNGTQQSEDFNGFKSQAAIVTLKPAPSVSWNINYYTGREARDLNPALNPGIPSLPTQPGLSVEPVDTFDRSRLHIIDTYASWTKGRTVLAGEADYVTLRPDVGTSSNVKGAATYAQYLFNQQFQVAGRYVYFDDADGLFSGLPQKLQDTTATATYQVSDGMMLRGEWRRDFSSKAFFLGSVEDRRRAQQTVTLGLVWWFGTKRGSW
jgi:putative OmpL-like beta-barrel porin-2